MKIKTCPFCTEIPPIGRHEKIVHLCRVVGLIETPVSCWNTRWKTTPAKPQYEAPQQELGLKIERSEKQKARDNLLCALASAEMEEPISHLTGPEARRHAQALSVIQLITPEVLPAEIEARARNYVTHFDQAPTSNALAKWWRKCERPNSRTFGRAPTPEQKTARVDDANRRETQAFARRFGLPPT